MKELIEKILKYLPKYFTDFGSLFVSPKRFIAQRNTVAEDTFGESLLFLSICLVVVVIMTAPLLPPEKDLWTYVGANAVISLVTVSLIALALHFAWLIVGGKAPMRSFFVTYAYFFGVVVIIVTFFILLSEGVFKVFEPELYIKMAEARFNKQTIPDVSGSIITIVYFIILMIGIIFVAVWSFISWGAFRELNKLSKVRSFFAYIIMSILNGIVSVIVFFVSSAIY